MNAIPAHWSALPKRSPERPIFRLAAIANWNTIMGGVSALVIADRAVRMKLPRAREMTSAVSDVYSSSTGRVPSHLHPWKCNECGSVYADIDHAAVCCYEEVDFL